MPCFDLILIYSLQKLFNKLMENGFQLQNLWIGNFKDISHIVIVFFVDKIKELKGHISVNSYSCLSVSYHDLDASKNLFTI